MHRPQVIEWSTSFKLVLTAKDHPSADLQKIGEKLERSHHADNVKRFFDREMIFPKDGLDLGFLGG